MIGPFVDYFILVSVAGVGVIQVAAAWSGLRCLMLIADRRSCLAVGAVLVVGAFLWYVLSDLDSGNPVGPRNYPDTAGGLSGNQSTWLFCAASAAAIAFTLAGSSLLNWRLGSKREAFEPGLDALRETTFLQAFLRTLRSLWTRS